MVVLLSFSEGCNNRPRIQASFFRNCSVDYTNNLLKQREEKESSQLCSARITYQLRGTEIRETVISCKIVISQLWQNKHKITLITYIIIIRSPRRIIHKHICLCTHLESERCDQGYYTGFLLLFLFQQSELPNLCFEALCENNHVGLNRFPGTPVVLLKKRLLLKFHTEKQNHFYRRSMILTFQRPRIIASVAD